MGRRQRIDAFKGEPQGRVYWAGLGRRVACCEAFFFFTVLAGYSSRTRSLYLSAALLRVHLKDFPSLSYTAYVAGFFSVGRCLIFSHKQREGDRPALALIVVYSAVVGFSRPTNDGNKLRATGEEA